MGTKDHDLDNSQTSDADIAIALAWFSRLACLLACLTRIEASVTLPRTFWFVAREAPSVNNESWEWVR